MTLMPTHRRARLAGLPELGVDAAARAAGADPDVLRLENLDTDIPPPDAALAATRESVGLDDANSYLPFNGLLELRESVAARLERQTGVAYDPERDIVITCGGTEGIFDALLATVQEGDEVVVTDPTYVGMISRVRLTGATPVFVPFRRRADAWRLDLDRLQAGVTDRTRALLVMNQSMPSGAALDAAEWDAIGAVCRERGCWLIYNAAMERIVFDRRRMVAARRHVASRPDRGRGRGPAARARPRGGDAHGRLGCRQRTAARADRVRQRADRSPTWARTALCSGAGLTTIALPPPRRFGSAAASTSSSPRNSIPVAAPISRADGGVVVTASTWPRFSSAAASGVPRNSASVCVVALLRWLSRGAAIASGSDIPKSRRLSSTWVTVVMIDAPPGDPSARNGLPSRSTMVGAIDERGRLPGSTLLAPLVAPVAGSRLKSVSSLLSRNP